MRIGEMHTAQCELRKQLTNAFFNFSRLRADSCYTRSYYHLYVPIYNALDPAYRTLYAALREKTFHADR